MYNDYKVKPSHIMLSKTRTYVKSYDGQTKWMYFVTEDDDLFKKILLLSIFSCGQEYFTKYLNFLYSLKFLEALVVQCFSGEIPLKLSH